MFSALNLSTGIIYNCSSKKQCKTSSELKNCLRTFTEKQQCMLRRRPRPRQLFKHRQGTANGQGTRDSTRRGVCPPSGPRPRPRSAGHGGGRLPGDKAQRRQSPLGMRRRWLEQRPRPPRTPGPEGRARASPRPAHSPAGSRKHSEPAAAPGAPRTASPEGLPCPRPSRTRKTALPPPRAPLWPGPPHLTGRRGNNPGPWQAAPAAVSAPAPPTTSFPAG